MHIVYILQSEKLNRFYIGYTQNLDVRLDFHLHDSQTRKFTHKAKDWEVFLTIPCFSRFQALHIEKHIKAMKSKTYITNLKIHREILKNLLSRYAGDTESESR